MKKYLAYIYRAAAGQRRAIALRTLLGIVRVAASLAFVWFSKIAIDCATGRLPSTPRALAGWFALMVGCMIVQVAINQAVAYIETRASMRMANRLNRRLYNTLMAMPLVRGQQGFHSGDMLNRLTLDVRTLAQFAVSQLPSMIVMAVQLAASFAFLACLNPWLALAPLVIMPACLLAGKLFFKRQRRLTAELRQGESDMQVSIQEGLKHRTVLLSLESVPEMDHRLGSIQQRLDHTNRQQARLSAASGAMARLGFSIGFLTAFGVGIFNLQAGIITFGTMTAFLQLVSRIQNPIASLAGYVPIFISTSVAVDRLSEIDMPMANSPFSILHSPSFIPLSHAGVRVNNLSFKYQDDGRDVLTSFSHDFTPGSRTMIVGSTGAGKTTLVKLLLGLLRPDAGTIDVYSEATSQHASAATLCNFVYVPQGNTLLHGTIRDNLRLADPDADDQRLAQALRTAAADFVFDLPQGLDTACDEAGAGLSEGQAQRIAIARALLRPGSILVLDEFNSALDADTAALLMQRLCAARPDATIIIIAHHRTAIAPHCTDVVTL